MICFVFQLIRVCLSVFRACQFFLFTLPQLLDAERKFFFVVARRKVLGFRLLIVELWSAARDGSVFFKTLRDTSWVSSCLSTTHVAMVMRRNSLQGCVA